MLTTVTDILHDEGFLEGGQEPVFHIRLISGRELNVQVFANNGIHFHTRVKHRGVMPTEYDKCSNGWRRFPQYAPEPLGQYFRHDWEIIIVRGIAHRPVLIGDIAKNKHDLVQKLIGFFATSTEVVSMKKPLESHRTFLRGVRDRAIDPAAAAVVNKWMSTDELDHLPHISQHGDFVVNNLGIGGSRLVVFDWEDFDRVALPGFDLCTALASDTRLTPERMRAVMHSTGGVSQPYETLLRTVCPLLGLTPDGFRRMIPLYLAIFLDLKRNYGEAVQAAVRKLIQCLHS